MKGRPAYRRSTEIGVILVFAIVLGVAITHNPIAVGVVVFSAALFAASYVNATVAAIGAMGWTLSVVFESGPAVLLGADARLVAVGFAFVLFARHRRRALRQAQQTSAVTRAIALYGVPLGLVALITADVASAIAAVTGLVFTVVVSTALAWSISTFRMVRILAGLNLSVVSGSIAFLVLSSGGVVADRATGLFGNANALGLFCALTAPFVIAAWGWKNPALIANVILVVMSGSRAGGAALLLAAGVMVARRRGKRWHGGIVMAAGVVLVLTAAIVSYGGGRAQLQPNSIDVAWGEDSRSELWSKAIETIKSRPVTGYGLGYDQQDTASSPLRIALEGGFLGILLSVPLAVVVVRRGLADHGPFGAVLLAGLFNSLFESWFLVGGSPFFVIYVVTAVYAGHSYRAGPMRPRAWLRPGRSDRTQLPVARAVGGFRAAASR